MLYKSKHEGRDQVQGIDIKNVEGDFDEIKEVDVLKSKHGYKKVG